MMAIGEALKIKAGLGLTPIRRKYFKMWIIFAL